MKTAWSQSGKLTPGSNQAVSLQTQFESTGNYTVQFSVDGPDENGSAGVRRTKALVTWSVEGNSVTREIDIVNGSSITGVAQAVSVKAYDASASPNTLGQYIVSVQVAKGSRPSVQQPPYLTTDVVILSAGADTAEVPVPQNAGAISVFVTATAVFAGTPIPAPTDLQVRHNAGTITTLKSYSPLVQTGWVPLASGTTAIFLNQGAAAPSTFWTVTFGIDG